MVDDGFVVAVEGRMDQGRVAAGEFLYQFLRTVESVLLALTDERAFACLVDGDPYPDELGSTDAVDFDLIDGRRKSFGPFRLRAAVQTLSSVQGRFSRFWPDGEQGRSRRVRAADEHRP
jgi:hypothetical protein